MMLRLAKIVALPLIVLALNATEVEQLENEMDSILDNEEDDLEMMHFANLERNVLIRPLEELLH